MLKLLLEKLTLDPSQEQPPLTPREAHTLKLIKIVHNSAIHLSNVIEDYLDITRIENSTFQIFKDVFNLRATFQEVFDIMLFQFEQKNLGFKLNVAKEVPKSIFSD
jgi:signal transduction histidine kinase